VTLAKFDVATPTFNVWRISATNVLTELPGFSPARDAALTERFPWWDVHTFPNQKVVCYSGEVAELPKFLAKLKVFAVKREDHYTMYIEAWVLQR
jgi:hypothetical protein